MGHAFLVPYCLCLVYLLRRNRSLFNFNGSLGKIEDSSAVTFVVGKRVLARGDDMILLRCLDNSAMLKLNAESVVGVGVSKVKALPLFVLLLEFVRANTGCGCSSDIHWDVPFLFFIGTLDLCREYQFNVLAMFAVELEFGLELIFDSGMGSVISALINGEGTLSISENCGGGGGGREVREVLRERYPSFLTSCSRRCLTSVKSQLFLSQPISNC